MPSRIETKELLVQDYRAEIAELRRQLEPYQLGWRKGEHRGNGAWMDTTEKHIAAVERNIALYERMIAILEKQMRDPAQSRRFIETARALECDEDEAAFDEKLKRIAQAKPAPLKSLPKRPRKTTVTG
jgi:hypothetical protein